MHDAVVLKQNSNVKARPKFSPHHRKGIAGQNKIERRKKDSFIQKILEHLTEKQVAEFLKANEAWKIFTLASAEVAALKYEGGSI